MLMGQTVSPFIHAGGAGWEWERAAQSIYLLSCSASCPTKDVKISSELSYFPVFIHTCAGAEHLSLALSADDLSEIPPGT